MPGSHGINAAVYAKLPYVVQQFIAYAKARPGQQWTPLAKMVGIKVD